MQSKSKTATKMIHIPVTEEEFNAIDAASKHTGTSVTRLAYLLMRAGLSWVSDKGYGDIIRIQSLT